MNRLLILLAACAPFAAAAQLAPCTGVPYDNGSEDLRDLASVSAGKAHQIAIDALGGGPVRTERGNLERVGDCLVYRYRLRPAGGDPRVVIVDAGNGNVLAIENEASHAIIAPPGVAVVPEPVLVAPPAGSVVIVPEPPLDRPIR